MPIHHFVYHRPRLTTAIVAGLGLGLFLPGEYSPITQALLAWTTGIWIYLLLMAWLMTTANHARVCQIAQQEDRSGVMVLFLMSLGAMASIVAIIWELTLPSQANSPLRLAHYALTAATIIGSWCFVAVLFTFHYARLYYTASDNQPPLGFPDQELQPNYWDFLYFSFTIAVAAQTSDIVIRSRRMRKTVLAQAVLSFFFNLAIIGFSINIAASIVNTSS